eukprot:gb/GECH01007542.1/.p1 GENE.gb/GECH01007542.1/~~gb/GECH01007542.1/.p1  ORF type:complete len:446 (+),score=116.21 gb/GECH01007542.1/:1-1338(+)
MEKIRKLYLSLEPPAKIMEYLREYPEYTSPLNQRNFIQQIINHKIPQKFPPPPHLTMSLIELYLEDISVQEYPVEEDLFEFLKYFREKTNKVGGGVTRSCAAHYITWERLPKPPKNHFSHFNSENNNSSYPQNNSTSYSTSSYSSLFLSSSPETKTNSNSDSKSFEIKSETKNHFPFFEKKFFSDSSSINDNSDNKPNSIQSSNTSFNITLRIWDRFTHVGLGMWEAGYYLAEVLLEYGGDLCGGRRVLELGSGVGLTGIAVYRAEGEPPERMMLSDHRRMVLQNNAQNLELNNVPQIPYFEDQNDSDSDSDLDLDSDFNNSDSDQNELWTDIIYLDWEKVSRTRLQRLAPDIILGADLVYDVEIIPPLARVLEVLMQEAGKSVEAVFAIARRNEHTFAQFQAACDEKGIEWEQVDHRFPLSQRYFRYSLEGVSLYHGYVKSKEK